MTCLLAYGIKLGLFNPGFFLSQTLKRMTDWGLFPAHHHYSMTLQHAIPLNNKGQILCADEHENSCISRYKTRKTTRLRPDLLTSNAITDVWFCCSDGKKPMQYSLSGCFSKRCTICFNISRKKLPYKNIFTQQLNLDSVTS